MSALPRDRRNAALCGLVAPHEVDAVARPTIIEEALRKTLKKMRAAPSGAADGRSRIAGIINNLDPDEAEDVMRAIGRARPKDAAILKTMLFSFNDLPKLSERARALLFDRASIDIVVMALRGTDPEFRNAVLSSMPSRGRRLVEGELASGAPGAAARNRQGAQGHHRHRARHGRPQRDRTGAGAGRRSGVRPVRRLRTAALE